MKITPSKTQPNKGVVRMEFAWPNDRRTPSKRDEIGPPPHSPKAARRAPQKNPHLRRSRDIPPAKTSTLTEGSGGFKAGRRALGGPAHAQLGHSRPGSDQQQVKPMSAPSPIVTEVVSR